MTYTCTLGPYHPALLAPALIRMRVAGSTVLDAVMELGYGHRDLENTASGATYWRALGIVEKLCGMCSQSNMLAFSQVVEAMHEHTVTVRARRLRVVMAEMERIQSHLFSVARLTTILGFDALAFRLLEIRESMLDLVERLGGNRVCAGQPVPGGVARDVDDPAGLQDQIQRLKRPLYDTVNTLINDRSITSRTVGIGLLTQEDALRLGTVGPVARASGVETDTRLSSPYSGYEELGFSLVTQTGGDVYARTVVRLLECFESLKLVERALDDLPEGPVLTEMPAAFPGVAAAGRVEAPGGETYFYIIGDGSDRLAHLKVRAASYANAQALPIVLKGQQLADVPAVLASLGLCLPCVER